MRIRGTALRLCLSSLSGINGRYFGTCTSVKVTIRRCPRDRIPLTVELLQGSPDTRQYAPIGKAMILASREARVHSNRFMLHITIVAIKFLAEAFAYP